MPPLLHAVMAIVGIGCLSIAACYSVMALIAVLIWRRQFSRTVPLSDCQPPITILKPLCGAEPSLYEHLRSFCAQIYPEFQIIFGVRDAADPALVVVQRLVAEFPMLAIDVVADPRQHGNNFKNSNLMNMLEVARHDILVIADSDTAVGADYLSSVTPPLRDANVGLVTCVYRSVPTQTIWSRLGAMYINEWFMPSVLLAWLFGHQNYASGQTLCVRRETLQAIGGLRMIADHLADDYRLGELIRGLGLRIVLSSYRIEAEHHEPNLKALVRHQLRWMRTLHVLSPCSFRMIFLTFSLPLAIVGVLLAVLGSSDAFVIAVLFGITFLAQLGLHLVHRWRGDRPELVDLWLVPARDLLLCSIWCRSFFTSRVTWRGSEFNVDARGVMRRSA